jgi:superfamily I DNA and RNA helicase
LANFFSSSELDGSLYIGYPIMGFPEGAFPLDALLISPDIGLVIFHIIEGTKIENIEEIQDNIYTKLQAKLLLNKSLVKSRKLLVEIHVVTLLQSISTLLKGKRRDIKKTDSRGKKLKDLEDSIANLDNTLKSSSY